MTREEAAKKLIELPLPKLNGNSEEETETWLNTYIKPINMAIKVLEQTRWIPVSERLPEDHDWYVIVVKEKSTGYQYIPRIASHNYDNCWSIIDTEDVNKEWLDDLECIAWMPLPQPYKGESEVQDAYCD